MLFCPKQFVLTTAGLTFLALVAGGVMAGLFGMGHLLVPMVLAAPSIAAWFEAFRVAVLTGREPEPLMMWRASYQMATIYTQIVCLLCVLLFILAPNPPFLLNLQAFLGLSILLGVFFGSVTLALRVSYALGVYHAGKQRSA